MSNCGESQKIMIDTVLNITIPDNNVPEREYACSILFGTLLQIPYKVFVSEVQKETIVKVGIRSLIFEDHFFNAYPSSLSYLKKENIPVKAGIFHDDKGGEIPMIFGKDTLTVTDNEIVCGNDVLAGVFFLTSRWEEFVLGRQETGKCDEQLLYVVRNDLSSIPLVHIYERFVKDMLINLHYPLIVNRQFSVKTTHDVDRCYLTGWMEMLKNVHKLYKQGKRKVAKKLLHDYIWYKRLCPEPFDTYSFFMDCADRYHTDDFYFFKTCIEGEKGFTYSIEEERVKEMTASVVRRGYTLGVHPSESTYGNTDQFEKEIGRFQVIDNQMICGRNHGLYCNTTTYHQWENAGAAFVSNYGFQYRNGFRCGICVPFPLFDIYERQQLKINELPFELMDTVLLRNKPTVDEALKDMLLIVNQVAENSGVLCMNWHTNVYNMPDMQKYKTVYTELLARTDYIRERVS